MSGEEELVRLRDLPGISDITDLCRNQRNFDYPVSSDTQAKIDGASVRLFGITQLDTNWEAERDRLYYSDDFDDVEDVDDDDDADDVSDEEETETETVDYAAAETAWDLQFHVTSLSFPASEPFWRAVGWDISDGAGKELLCAHLFDRQIIAAVGSLVSGARLSLDGSGRTELDDEHTEANLADRLDREAQEFMARRRR